MQRPRYAIASESLGPEIRLRTVPLAAGAMLNEIDGKITIEIFVKIGGIEMGNVCTMYGEDVTFAVCFLVFFCCCLGTVECKYFQRYSLHNLMYIS